MYNLNTAYSPKFFRQRRSLAWRVPIMCEAIDLVLHPESVIDLGCGNGDLLSWFHKRGMFVVGIEGTENCLDSLMIPKSHFFEHDLRLEIYPSDFEFSLGYDWTLQTTEISFDLALCLEVAEHIEPEYTQTFVDNICSCSPRVLFSAAGPGQGGRHHVNCQPKAYWVEMFLARGYLREPVVENLIKNKIKHKAHVKGIKAWYQNLIYFEQKLNIKGR